MNRGKGWFALIGILAMAAIGVLMWVSDGHSQVSGLVGGDSVMAADELAGWPDAADAATKITPDTEPEYELSFTIKYNKIPAGQIRDLIYKIMTEHKDTCDVDVHVKKPGSDFIVFEDSITFLNQ